MRGGELPGLQAAAGQVYSERDVLEFLEQLKEDAVRGVPIHDQDGVVVGYRRDASVMRLFSDIAIGKPRTRKATPGAAIDPAGLGTLEGCHAFLGQIALAELGGGIDPEQANGLRRTVDLALKSLALKAQDESPDQSRPVKVIVQTYEGAPDS